MMGSGKSTIGAIIAKKMNLNHVDTDKEIEKLENTSINKIFEEKGEKYFRRIEEKISTKKIKLKNTIISLGGGGFLNDRIKKIILKDCLSFWLDWRDDEIINRLIKSQKRPKLKDLNKNDLLLMIKDRAKKYSHANFRVKCDNLTKFEIAEKIINIYKNEKN